MSGNSTNPSDLFHSATQFFVESVRQRRPIARGKTFQPKRLGNLFLQRRERSFSVCFVHEKLTQHNTKGKKSAADVTHLLKPHPD